MALATFKPTVTAREPFVDSSVVAEPRKHEIYDHKETPLWSLDSFMSGSPWELLAYFSQRLGKNDTTKKLDLNSTPAYQSYTKIEKLEILVQSALSPAFRDKEQIMEVTGTASIYSLLTPNVDDYFLATSNLAKLGLFRIVNVNRRTFERESIHAVEYMVEKEITENDPEYKDLMRKAVSTFVFSKQRLIENRNPLLLKHTYTKIANLQDLYKSLVTNYFSSFFQTVSSTLLVPGQTMKHYDPMLTDFICQIVSTRDAPQLQRMHLFSLDNDQSFKIDNIWSLMLKRGIENLPYLVQTMGKLSPLSMHTSFYGRSGNFGNADYFICPKLFDTSSYPVRELIPQTTQISQGEVLNFKRTNTYGGGELDSETVVYNNGGVEIPVYTPIHTLDTYIFPKSFYEGEKKTLIEILTMDYIQRASINLDMLLFMTSYYQKLERLEQFYFGPILMTLLKEADRGAYA